LQAHRVSELGGVQLTDLINFIANEPSGETHRFSSQQEIIVFVGILV